jgi:hypothetical protein
MDMMEKSSADEVPQEISQQPFDDDDDDDVLTYNRDDKFSSEPGVPIIIKTFLRRHS